MRKKTARSIACFYQFAMSFRLTYGTHSEPRNGFRVQFLQLYFFFSPCLCVTNEYTRKWTEWKTPQSRSIINSLFTNIGFSTAFVSLSRDILPLTLTFAHLLLTMITAFIASAPNHSSTHTTNRVHYDEIITYTDRPKTTPYEIHSQWATVKLSIFCIVHFSLRRVLKLNGSK